MTGSGLGGFILGIESSCDETAAAVVRGGREVLSNVVASQIALHANYGGVVPELASREHLRNIVPVVRAAMREAQVGFAELDAIAVTEGPGLAGALLVGITYAKALALGLGKPLVAVNHLEGHIQAVLMEGVGSTEVQEGPLMCLVVSGGHTHLYLAEDSELGEIEDLRVSPLQRRRSPPPVEMTVSRLGGLWRYRNVGRTVDDAAGEAFDKVAKLLGLGYPGGPWMDGLAGFGNARAVPFHFAEIKARRSVVAGNKQIPSLRFGIIDGEGQQATFDFSFSGIKTAVLRYVQAHGMGARVEVRRSALVEMLRQHPEIKAGDALRMHPELFDGETLDLIASFQCAVVGVLMRQTFAAAAVFGARGVLVSGGVAANNELRRRFAEEGARRRLRVAFPTVAMSTDNAAMIAAAGWGKFVAGEFAGDGLAAVPQLQLG